MQDHERIRPVSTQTLKEFENKKVEIINEVVNQSMRYDDEISHHGDNAHRLITSGVKFTTKMLEAAMATGEISLLEDQLTWAMDRLPYDGVKPEHILHRFIIYKEVIKDRVPKCHADEINQFITWMIKRQEEFINQETADGKS